MDPLFSPVLYVRFRSTPPPLLLSAYVFNGNLPKIIKCKKGTHLLEDDSSVELFSTDELVHKILHVHDVRACVDVFIDEDGTVDAWINMMPLKINIY